MKNQTVFRVGLVVCATLNVMLQAQPTTAALKEFTIIIREGTRTLPGGSWQNSVMFYAQRSDGSWAKGPYASSDQTAHGSVRSVLFRPNGQRVLVDDTQRLKSTRNVSLSPLEARAADPMCGLSSIGPKLKPRYKGTVQIMGFKAVIIETQEGPLLHTDWKSPDLDCYEIKTTEERRDDAGELIGQFEREAVDIKTVTPDPKYFTIPEEYREASPSEMEAARRARFGISTLR